MFIVGASILLKLLLFPLFEQAYLVLDLLFDGVLLLSNRLLLPSCLGSVFFLHLGLLDILLLLDSLLILHMAQSVLDLL
jgi:hypothetical protein